MGKSLAPPLDIKTGSCGQYTLFKIQVLLWLSLIKPLGGFPRLLEWGPESLPGPRDTPQSLPAAPTNSLVPLSLQPRWPACSQSLGYWAPYHCGPLHKIAPPSTLKPGPSPRKLLDFGWGVFSLEALPPPLIHAPLNSTPFLGIPCLGSFNLWNKPKQ